MNFKYLFKHEEVEQDKENPEWVCKSEGREMKKKE